MKKNVIALFVILAILAGSCKDGKFSLFGNSKEKENMIKQLKAKSLADSAKYAAELERTKMESQTLIDSLSENCAAKTVVSGDYSYYVITGAFQESGNADRYKAKMDQMGYVSEIIDGPYGYRMVSVSGSNNLNESINIMNTMRNSVTENAWVYVKK